jgi:Fungal pheromone mating factor STE2 GPCR
MSEFPSFQIGTNYSVPPDFDPVAQPVWYLLQNGTVHDPFTFDRIDAEIFYVAQWSLVYGCTIGAAVMTMLHVLALTPLTKRRTLIFWLNVIGLCQVLVRGIVASLYYTRDRFQTLYVLLSGDSTSVPPLHRFHSTISVILSVTSIATVEVIFFVQGRAILSSLPRKVYFGVISTLVLFGLIAITARLIYAVYNIQDIWVWNHIDRDSTLVPRWCEPTSELMSFLLLVCILILSALITYVVTIGTWSFVWTCFIGRQIFLRWKMNIMRGKSFGAMNVLFLAGIQSMILPRTYPTILFPFVFYPSSDGRAVFFLIMQFVPSEHTFIGAEYIVVPSVLCLMPFSCLWAGTISSANGQGCDEPTRTPHSLGKRSANAPFAKLFSSAKSESPTTTARNLSGATATGPPNPTPMSPKITNHLDKLYPELREDERIAVTQTYGVRSDNTSRNDSAV